MAVSGKAANRRERHGFFFATQLPCCVLNTTEGNRLIVVQSEAVRRWK